MIDAADFLKWCEVFQVSFGGGGGPGTLQQAYNNGDGSILEIPGKPLVLKDLSAVGDASSLLELFSTTKGSRPFPPMTTAQRNSIVSPANGLMIYNTDTAQINYYDFLTASWVAVDSASGAFLEAANNLSDVASINTSVNNLYNNAAFTVIYVSNFGIDAVNRGNQLNPYQTLDYAISQITDNSSSKPYLIILEMGIYTVVTLNLKPNISYQGIGSQLSVTTSVTLDSGWSGGGFSYLKDFSLLDFPTTVNLDFDALSPTADSLINISSNLTTSNTKITINGDSVNRTFVQILNTFGYFGNFYYYLTNCFPLIKNSQIVELSVTRTSESVGNNVNIIDTSIISTLSISSSTVAPTNVFHENCKMFGAALYQMTGSGDLSVYAKGNTYSSTLTLDDGGSSGNVIFSADFLSALPTLLNGATYTPTTLGNSALANFTPANYTPVDSSVSGNLQGIDNALGSGVSPDLDDVYNNGTNATVNLISSRPISFQTISSSSGVEAITTPSTGSNIVGNFRIIGFTFTVNVQLQITALQYDDNLFTQSGTRQTGIFDKSTQVLLAEVFISKTDALVSGYRTAYLSEQLTVYPGVEYVFATVMAGGESNHLNSDATTSLDVNAIESAVLPSSLFLIPLSFPQSFTVSANTIPVGSFLYNTFIVEESINFNDQSSDSTIFQEIKSTARAAIIEPVMTLAQANAIGITNIGASVFVTDVSIRRPYRFTGLTLEAIAYVNDIPFIPILTQGQIIIGVTGTDPVSGDITSPNSTITKDVSTNGQIKLDVASPVPSLTQGQLPMGVSGGTGLAQAGSLVSSDTTIGIITTTDNQINLSSLATLQDAYNNGEVIILDNTHILFIIDSTSANSIGFYGDGTNPLMKFNGTTNSTIPYAVMTDSQFASIPLHQGIIAFGTTSNRLLIYDGMATNKSAYLTDFLSGTFTASVTNVSGTSSISFLKGMYTTCGLQPGNIVSCSLQFSCSVSATTVVTVKIASLPVSPNTFSNINQAMTKGGFIYTNGTPLIGDGQVLDTTANTSANDVNFSFLVSNTVGTKIVTVDISYVIQ